MWKVYHIPSGRIVKAGFDSDEQAKDWMERRDDLADEDHDVEEMDDEEEEEFLEQREELDDDGPLAGDAYEADFEEGEEAARPVSIPDEELPTGLAEDEEEEEEDAF